jgi:tRNA pseudouridine38-40 synthase
VIELYRYKLTIAYDGTNYAGWQIQQGVITVQSELERALNTLAGKLIRVYGSGRTDQGVHARGQTAHLDLPHKMPPSDLRRAMNALLKPDIRVMNARLAAKDFHARNNVKIKEYRYFIWNSQIMPPFMRYYKTHIKHNLDVSDMRKAALFLLGKKDFAAFAANPKYKLATTIRHIYSITIRKHGSDIVIIIKGNGFLYKMVRSISGFLIRVGRKSVPAEITGNIITSKKRTALVPTAPPQGLFLWKVQY